MDRQNSTSPLVHSNGLDDSQTSMELKLSPESRQLPPIKVKKPSQVEPIAEKEKEANGHAIADGADKANNSSCGLTAGRLITSLIIGVWFGWFLQKSSGMTYSSPKNQSKSQSPMFVTSSYR